MHWGSEPSGCWTVELPEDGITGHAACPYISKCVESWVECELSGLCRSAKEEGQERCLTGTQGAEQDGVPRTKSPT